jgi:hypothetical protein
MASDKGDLEADIDALFAVPLAEFTAARNALAARLKQEGRGDEAARLKAMVKPSISAWAVNQLYRKHRESFDRLMATGQRFRQVQASQLAGKGADLRAEGDARRKAVSDLARLAAELLRDAGHNATLDTMRRITTTLEAMSVYASLPDAPTPGRLTEDVDPPGFEALTALIADGKMTDRAQEPAPVTSFQSSQPSEAPAGNVRKLEEMRKTRIAAAKVSLRDAEHALNDARARAQDVDTALKKAAADAKEAEKQKVDAEERFRKASALADEAERRARSVAAQAQETAKAVENALRTVEKATRELQSLLQESAGRG